MENKLIVTDIDGVCLNYLGSFIEWVDETHGWEVDPKSPCDTYCLSSWFLPNKGRKMGEADFVGLIAEYNNYPRVLPPVEYSQKCLRLLREGGYRIIALSSFGGCKLTQHFRRAYLNVVFGGIFDDIIILPLGACKRDKLKELSPEYFVEDCLAYAEQGVALGIKTFLLRTTYNAGGEDIIYVNNWNEILYIISELEGEKNYEQI